MNAAIARSRRDEIEFRAQERILRPHEDARPPANQPLVTGHRRIVKIWIHQNVAIVLSVCQVVDDQYSTEGRPKHLLPLPFETVFIHDEQIRYECHSAQGSEG